MIYSDLRDLTRWERLDVDIEIDDEGYLMILGARFDSDEADELMDFYKNFGDELKDESLTVYGNSGAARDAVIEKDALGSYRSGEWAINAGKILGYLTGKEEDFYERAITHLGASTLQAVSLSQRDWKDRPEKYGFYLDIVKEMEETEEGPVEIPVSEEPRFNYEDIVSGTVRESKDRIQELESGEKLHKEDYRRMLEAEESKEDNRVTLERFIEERLEEIDDSTFPVYRGFWVALKTLK